MMGVRPKNKRVIREDSSFVRQWVALMRPAYDGLDGLGDRTARLVALEQAAVLLSLENLMTFDFVREKVVAGDLSLHGAWLNIKSGRFENL